MSNKKIQNRNSTLDIIRIIAVILVMSMHFLVYTGFYQEVVSGLPMFIMYNMRVVFLTCVPTFIMLTGYLMCHKELSKKYYKGIINVLVIYAIATLLCMIVKCLFNGELLNIKNYIFKLLDFTGANYGWYVEMYIGLYMLIPFINLSYNSLKTQKHKQALVLTMICLTVIPAVFNVYNFDSTYWWLHPTTSYSFQKLFPMWWIYIYPLTYYFTGCYLREYGLNIKTGKLVIMLVLSILLFGTYNYYRDYGTTFTELLYNHWYSCEVYVVSVLSFSILLRIKTENYSDNIKLILFKISELTFGMYLISYIFDKLIYTTLYKYVGTVAERLPYYFIVIPIIFLLSAVASFFMNILADLLIKLGSKIKSLCIKHRD
ncbi:MAG: acyltransferase family protein [Ruminococcus sp.]|nr:acyltransferase family protein [Ruminococcus sp.]